MYQAVGFLLYETFDMWCHFVSQVLHLWVKFSVLIAFLGTQKKSGQHKWNWIQPVWRFERKRMSATCISLAALLGSKTVKPYMLKKKYT